MSGRTASSHGMLEPKRGVLILSGYALRVAVERGHLVVEAGVAVSGLGG